MSGGLGAKMVWSQFMSYGKTTVGLLLFNIHLQMHWIGGWGSNELRILQLT